MNTVAADRKNLQAVFPQSFVEGKLNIDRIPIMCSARKFLKKKT